ncbi:MAG: S9 family peptidase [Verrucomicrobiales bacterium]|nr:S9 family peptidase [Verrucomicrobiales bacterium]
MTIYRPHTRTAPIPRLAHPLCLGGLCLLLGAVAAEPGDARRDGLSLDRIFAGEFNAAGYDARWAPEGAGYLRFEDAKSGHGRDLVRYDAATGRREVLVQGQWFIPPGRESPLGIEHYDLSPDGSRLLIYTNSRRVWRQNTRGDYWLLDVSSHELRKLGGDAPESSMMFAAFSPDGTRVAFVREHNLCVQNLGDMTIVQLTTDGDEHHINGTFDWVYEEELDLRKGFEWSPDSRWLAFWQIDTTHVREFVLVNNTDGLYPEITRFPYPKTGETNPSARAGVVSAGGGKTEWIDLPGDPREHYLARMSWVEKPQDLVIQQLDRRQHTNQVWIASPGAESPHRFFAETDEAWVDVRDDAVWFDDDRKLLWLSERDGWRHAYSIARENGKAHRLTRGNYDVIDVLGLDEAKGLFYFTASPKNATEQYLFRAPLKGGKARRVTPKDQPGTHSYSLSPDRQWAIHTWSRFDVPPLVELINLPDHKRKTLFEDNEKLMKQLADLPPVQTEFFQVPTGEGAVLDGWRIMPPDFDAAKRYPVLFHVYGEPAGQTVLNRWGGRNAMWHRFLAEQGYVVMSIDNRGTPAPKGREWRKSIYGQVGILASADQAAALEAIRERWPWVDSARIGIWGWSGGGSMTLNALLRYPDRYQMGMAVAPVPNMRLYDTIYQERYMGLPGENPEGYLKGSPLTFAGQLKGDLLLVHGTGDDNVHYQGVEALINELVAYDKPFSMMAYPNRTHSIREGPGTSRHLFELLTRYLTEHLPAGPGDSLAGEVKGPHAP